MSLYNVQLLYTVVRKYRYQSSTSTFLFLLTVSLLFICVLVVSNWLICMCVLLCICIHIFSLYDLQSTSTVSYCFITSFPRTNSEIGGCFLLYAFLFAAHFQCDLPGYIIHSASSTWSSMQVLILNFGDLTGTGIASLVQVLSMYTNYSFNLYAICFGKCSSNEVFKLGFDKFLNLCFS